MPDIWPQRRSPWDLIDVYEESGGTTSVQRFNFETFLGDAASGSVLSHASMMTFRFTWFAYAETAAGQVAHGEVRMSQFWSGTALIGTLRQSIVAYAGPTPITTSGFGLSVSANGRVTPWVEIGGNNTYCALEALAWRTAVSRRPIPPHADIQITAVGVAI